MSWLAGYGKLDDGENDNLGVDWVLQYEFDDIGACCMGYPGGIDAHTDDLLDQAQATTEFRTLVHDLTEAGLRVQVRHGHGSSLLVCLRVPRDQLGRMVHQSR